MNFHQDNAQLDAFRNELSHLFALPDQDINRLSFCSTRVDKLTDWCESLPITQMARASAMLYQAIPEVVHLDVDPSTRLKMLEALRPSVQQCIAGMAKNLLTQSLVLNDNGYKAATVIQALQKHMTSGYSMVVTALTTQKELKRKSHPELALAITRAITGLGLMQFRACQIYVGTPPHLWQELHCLYRIAANFNVLHEAVADNMLQSHETTNAEHAYLRCLLLACSKPNQMAQKDIAHAYYAFENWVPHCHLKPVSHNGSHNLYRINLMSDQPPAAFTRINQQPDQWDWELDLSSLITTLQKQQQAPGSEIIKINRDISPQLLNQLIDSWQKEFQRQHPRRKVDAILQVVVGLSAIHKLLCGNKDFKLLMQKNNNSIDSTHFSSCDTSFEADPWSDAFDAGKGGAKFASFDTVFKNEQQGTHNTESHQVKLIDSSAGGYCLHWGQNVPVNLKAGEILAVRSGQQTPWSISVVRWIKQRKNSAQLGIQLLGHNPEPRAISAKRSNGPDSPFMPAIALEESSQLKLPQSLITASMPFHEKQKAQLNAFEYTSKVLLQNKLIASASISQFSYSEQQAEAKPTKPSSSRQRHRAQAVKPEADMPDFEDF